MNESDHNDDRDEHEERRSRRRGEDGPPERSLEELYAIARYQRAIIYCILFLLCDFFVLLPLPEEAKLVLVVIHVLITITAAVFVFMLSIRVFGTGSGILIALCTLLPCVSLLVLMVINSKATGTLNEYGVRVGFLGVGGSEMARLRRWAERDARR